jgi:hypothetical protein
MQTTMQEYQLTDRMPRVLTVKANGGTVEVQSRIGNDWVTADTYTEDTAVEVFFGLAHIRIVPTGAAGFAVE